MSYSDFLRTQQLNQARIFDRRERLGDASNYIQRTKLGASWIQGSTNHVINNVSNPFVPNPSTSKTPAKYTGSGAGGRVPDASLFTLSRGAAAIGADFFSSTKTVQRETIPCATRASPAASLVVRQGLNFDGLKGGDFNGTDFGGLNAGYIEPCSLFQPLTASHLVVRNPELNRLGVQSRESWNGAEGTQYGSQNPLSDNCTSTMTIANFATKVIPHGNAQSRPIRADFRTSVMGMQVSENGAFGRPGKLGGALAKSRYVEKHHGNPNVGHPSQVTFEDVTTNKPESYPIPRVA
jgi:hypothetical protein